MKITTQITSLTIRLLIVFLVIILTASLIELSGIIYKSIINSDLFSIFGNGPLDRNTLFFGKIQGLITAILLITILVELIASLVEYLKEGSANYVKIIVEIALIALIRHVLGLDIEHVASGTLFGISALIAVLGAFYIILRSNYPRLNQ